MSSQNVGVTQKWPKFKFQLSISIPISPFLRLGITYQGCTRYVTSYFPHNACLLFSLSNVSVFSFEKKLRKRWSASSWNTTFSYFLLAGYVEVWKKIHVKLVTNWQKKNWARLSLLPAQEENWGYWIVLNSTDAAFECHSLEII